MALHKCLYCCDDDDDDRCFVTITKVCLFNTCHCGTNRSTDSPTNKRNVASSATASALTTARQRSDGYSGSADQETHTGSRLVTPRGRTFPSASGRSETVTAKHAPVAYLYQILHRTGASVHLVKTSVRTSPTNQNAVIAMQSPIGPWRGTSVLYRVVNVNV